MSVACVQDIYKCDTCKSASDEHGRNCRHGILFPLLLLMGNCKKCMNYEFDAEKVKLQLQGKEEKAPAYSPDSDGIYRGKSAEGVLSCLLKSGNYATGKYAGTKGYFFDRKAEKWVAFDNSANECFVEEFNSETEAEEWLGEDCPSNSLHETINKRKI